MNIEQLIPVHKICTYYQVEISFIHGLKEIGLIEINTIEETGYIHQHQMSDIEKMIRMHHELDVNIEGIDVAFNLLQKINTLQQELKGARSRLKMYEG